MKMKLKFLLIFFILFLIPVILEAAIIKFENPLGYDDVEDIIDAFVDIILLVGIPIAILMILIAGFYFITSGGNPEKIKTAKRIIFWTVIGFTIILLAKGIIYLIKGVIGMS